MKRATFTLLLLVSLIYGDFQISQFSAGTSYPQPATSYLKPLTGTWLSPTDNITTGAHLRRRFSETEYRLYRGSFTQLISATKGNIQKFIRPSTLSSTQFTQLKYYDRERLNSHGDISECYFSGDTLFIVGLIQVSYNLDGMWFQLSAELGNHQSVTGDVALQTYPAGASIYVDGINKNVVTPNYITNLRPGMHRIRFMHPDFSTQDTVIQIVGGEILQFSTRLKSRYGAVDIGGSPRGATVRLEGQVVGTIPCKVENLVEGTYVFSIDSPFHSRRRVSTKISSGATSHLTVMLSKSYSVIELPDVPINEPWKINGEQVASGSLRFNPGTHRVVWNGGGKYNPIDTVLSVEIGDTVMLKARFTIRTGKVKVLPLPMACSLYIDGTYRGEAPMLIEDLQVGKHQIELRRDGFQNFTKVIDLKGGAVLPLRCQLTKLKASPSKSRTVLAKKEAVSHVKPVKGEVSFVSFPPCAEVYRGDSLVAITGKGSVKVPVGRYKFRFVNGDQSTVRTVTVASGERKAVMVNFGSSF